MLGDRFSNHGFLVPSILAEACNFLMASTAAILRGPLSPNSCVSEVSLPVLNRHSKPNSRFKNSLLSSSTIASTCRLSALSLSSRKARGKLHRSNISHIKASLDAVEQTYIMVKPDGVQRGLVGEIISRFECKGFLLKGLKLFCCPTELAEEHYKELKSKPFFPKLVEYITSGPVVCMAWEGPGIVAAARKLIGVTNPLQAEPGTIRGDFAIQVGRNVVHGSDSKENGEREIALWFKEDELCDWRQQMDPWLKE
eukprot:TRINITY_DN29136_c0_g1_i1.p1 TRINITY_DN29136_c0_g1~~TRINITY_DN29136_c0_g1_i1.p1  ORF type:complete len:254 (+),score=46.08 TRINITY_DN29136_c0_g1_i1:98-859(+)